MLVSDIMNSEVITIDQNETVALASRLLSRRNIGSLPVSDENGQLVGMLTDRDIVLRCVAANRDPEKTSIGSVMSRDIVSVSPYDEVSEALELMSAARVRRLPVAESGKLIGIVSLGDVSRLRACEMEIAAALAEISCNVKRLSEY